MEQVSLAKMSEDLSALRKVVSSIQMKIDLLVDKEDLVDIEPVSLDELSDEVVAEIEESMKKPESSFVSHEDVMAKFSL